MGLAVGGAGVRLTERGELLDADAGSHGVRLQFQRRCCIPNRQTFEKVAAQKRKNAAQSLLLRNVRDLVDNEQSVSPTVHSIKFGTPKSVQALRA
jgi:hypothetical protein